MASWLIVRSSVRLRRTGSTVTEVRPRRRRDIPTLRSRSGALGRFRRRRDLVRPLLPGTAVAPGRGRTGHGAAGLCTSSARAALKAKDLMLMGCVRQPIQSNQPTPRRGWRLNVRWPGLAGWYAVLLITILEPAVAAADSWSAASRMGVARASHVDAIGPRRSAGRGRNRTRAFLLTYLLPGGE